MKSKLEVKDLITIGIYSAIYFVMVTIATFGSAIFLGGFAYVLLPAVAALISGTIYMLLVAKVPKFGGISIMGIVMAIYFLISGHFILSFAANLVCGILADFIAKASGYKNKRVILASYVVFCYGCMGPVLPMWFMKAAYVANLEARGKSAEYIENMFANMTMTTFGIAVVAILVCATLGGLFGQRMLKKHFEKAGIV